jgi:hypothetical protein
VIPFNLNANTMLHITDSQVAELLDFRGGWLLASDEVRP